ncbi:MAG: hypothetical protein ACRYE9_01645 [Janthinobacterium lividum]
MTNEYSTSNNLRCKKPLSILRYINYNFLIFFSNKNFIVHKEVNICSGIDRSVRFIGSHTSVLKNYMIDSTLPDQGFAINQDCFKAKNLRFIDKDDQDLKVPSFFPCNGILLKYEYAPRAIDYLLEFFIHFLGINARSLEVLVNSDDRDLIDTFAKSGYLITLRPDTLIKEKYVHQKFGVENMSGRDCTIALKNSSSTGSVAAITIIEINKVPRFIEITISPLKIISQLYNYSSVFYCYLPSSYLEYDISQPFIKTIDCLISVTALFKYGLKPSNKDNRTRLFMKYIKYLQQQVNKSNLNISELCFIQNHFEHEYFQYSERVTSKIISSILGNNHEN